MSERRRTATSNFGVSRREAHDAAAFYARFEAPEIVRDSEVLKPDRIAESCIRGDARHMKEVANGSVALVVTSPPYFAGKQYEEELDRQGTPSSYFEYLDLLREVFAECKEKLEPGGRIAVNVANLGRKPYRSLSADVIRILQDDLHLLLRGEVIWRKGEGASGSCAWGSYRSAASPVLRDITERVVIASKGRFDRALSVKEREAKKLPHKNSISSDEFMAATLDVWDIAPESAKRVQHPAPFPVELPERLIRLYTYENDLVLDPFMGSGSALVAAAKVGRRFVGYDLDSDYVELARREAPDGRSPTGAAESVPKELEGRRRFHSASRAAGRGLSGTCIAQRQGGAGHRRAGSDRGEFLHCPAQPPPPRPGAVGQHPRRRLGGTKLVFRRDGSLHHDQGRSPADRYGLEVPRTCPRSGQQPGRGFRHPSRVPHLSFAETRQ